MIKLKLKDGSEKEVESGLSVYDVAKQISEGLARNATCERPSPIKENLLSTKVTPKSDEHKATKTPTIKAYCTNWNWK